jgi:protein-S-isoprenylcysteine O-methyltransferase Ste14
MRRFATLGYGLAVYGFFLWTILHAIGFSTGLVLPRTLDHAPLVAGWRGWAVDLGLLGLFAVQHMVMARRGFKERVNRLLPAAIERSNFVLATCLILNLLFFTWKGLPGVVWEVENELLAGALIGLSLLGWGVVFVTTFLIDHFELFGLAQTWRAFRGVEAKPKAFVTPSVYRISRHPMYLGFFIAFWATPLMTTSHLLFAVVTTAWVVFEVVVFEEPTLVDDFGNRYRDYQRDVRMFLPIPKEGTREAGMESRAT